MRSGSLDTVACAPRFHDDDGFVARRGPRRRHEFAWCLDRFDIQQDGPGPGVACQVVEKIAEVDVRVFAQRNHVRKADAARFCPVQNRCDKRTRLRHESNLPGQSIRMRKTRVQAKVRSQQSQAVRTQNTQPMRTRSLECRLFLRGAQARRHHDRSARSKRAQAFDHAGDCVGWGAQYGKVRHLRQVGDACVHGDAIQGCMLGIDGVDRPREPAGAQVAPDRGTHAADTVGRADHDDRSGLQQPVKMEDAHASAVKG